MQEEIIVPLALFDIRDAISNPLVTDWLAFIAAILGAFAAFFAAWQSMRMVCQTKKEIEESIANRTMQRALSLYPLRRDCLASMVGDNRNHLDSFLEIDIELLFTKEIVEQFRLYRDLQDELNVAIEVSDRLEALIKDDLSGVCYSDLVQLQSLSSTLNDEDYLEQLEKIVGDFGAKITIDNSEPRFYSYVANESHLARCRNRIQIEKGRLIMEMEAYVAESIREPFF